MVTKKKLDKQLISYLNIIMKIFILLSKYLDIVKLKII